jgi:predicted RNA methylase
MGEESSRVNAELASRKQNGAYYTDEAVARFLVSWALPQPGGAVLDPSCGDGVFLRQGLSVCSPETATGVDISPDAVRAAEAQVRGSPTRLICADFFSVSPSSLGHYDAVVGNPPFIRFHRFTGPARRQALEAAARAGVRLTALSSAWAPFMVHAIEFIRPGGRLAMVAPAELLHAAYALPVLRCLCERFGSIVLVTFERRLFPDLSQDALLVLGDNLGGLRQELRLLNLAHPEQLETLLDVDPFLQGGRALPVAPVVTGRERAVQYLLPELARRLYSRLESSGATARMGEWVTVSIGYVTGNNSFFHLSRRELLDLHIPARYLRRAVLQADQIAGLTLQESDWLGIAASGAKCGVLDVPAGEAGLPDGVRSYLKRGEDRGVHLAYKCAARRRWYSLNGLTPPDAFLSYMVHVHPVFAVNEAAVVAPNSLLVARLKPGSPSVRYVALASITSLACLSAEIEGHSLGGGLLKLEPGEAARLVLPRPAEVKGRLNETFEAADQLVRAGQLAEAQALADDALLTGIGLSARDVARLRRATEILRRRRLRR